MKKILPFLFVTIPFFTNAQWTGSTATGKAVTTHSSYEDNSKMISDGSGGAIVFWERNDGLGQALMYNHLDALGALTWGTTAAGGLQLFSSTTDYGYIEDIETDDAGGAFISYSTDNALYLQHISSTGTKLFSGNGILIRADASESRLARDGSGGVVLGYSDYLNDPDGYPLGRAQRIASNGTLLWSPAEGVQLTNNARNGDWDAPFEVINDGSNNFIFGIIDTRTSNYDPIADEFDNIDLYGQKLSASGVKQWGAGGTVICNQNKNQIVYGIDSKTPMVSDGQGGAYVMWSDYRTDPQNGNGSLSGDLYAQRINSSGSRLWSTDGVVILASTTDKYLYSMIFSPVGVMALWVEQRDGLGNYDIYGQLMAASNGALQLAAIGKLIAAAIDGDFQLAPTAGNSAVTVTYGAGDAIYAKKINLSDGSFPWGSAEKLVADNSSSDKSAPYIISDGAQAAIISWTQDTNAGDIYANKIGSDGILPVNLISFNALLKNQTALLEWKTASEYNTKEFLVQRSLDASNFETISSVAAKGNSSTVTGYDYSDPLVKLGIPANRQVYYRLEILDNDGKKYQSPIKAIRMPPTPLVVRIQGNNVSDILQMTITTPNAENTSIALFGTDGRVIFNRQTNLQAGENKVNISVTGLARGTYFVSIKTNQQTETLRILKN